MKIAMIILKRGYILSCTVALAAAMATLAGFRTTAACGANMSVTNVALKSALASGLVADVQFDVKWDASWRASWTETAVTPNVALTNWDAAWIFVKYRCRDGADTNWNHASLSTNNGDHSSPAGSTIKVGISTNGSSADFGAGVFLYRSANGSGSWTNSGVRLRWHYGEDGIASTSRVDVCAHAIEMVYVPQGSFYLGDGISTNIVPAITNITGQFENGKFTNAFLVTNEDYTINLGGGTDGTLGNNNREGTSTTDDFSDTLTQTLPPSFPKGYRAFYCMKYEASRDQYLAFLNQLTYTQATNRTGNGAITYLNASYPAYTTAAPTTAAGELIWQDIAAYYDWTGLRPMTEVEYEKACRGPLNPATNECAWGTTNAIRATGVSGDSGIETAVPANANSSYNGGPYRCGIFATTNSTREGSGASYWGIMEMSGSLWERPVTIGNGTGRGFTGLHGDGKLAAGGNADVNSWPTAETGVGFRGGGPNTQSVLSMRVSDRIQAALTWATRYNSAIRGVRAAP
jgi:hypothetical protein